MIVGVRYQCGHCPTSPSFNLVRLERKRKKECLNFNRFLVCQLRRAIISSSRSFSCLFQTSQACGQTFRVATDYIAAPVSVDLHCNLTCSKIWCSYHLPAGPPPNAPKTNDPKGLSYYIFGFREISFWSSFSYTLLQHTFLPSSIQLQSAIDAWLVSKAHGSDVAIASVTCATAAKKWTPMMTPTFF